MKELNKLQRSFNQKQNDYTEKVKEEAVTEDQTQDGEKKKKKKKRKNKKKNKGETALDAKAEQPITDSIT